MLASLLALFGGGLTMSHVAVAVASVGLTWWAKRHPAPKLADVVPAAHAPAIQTLLDRIEADPTVAGVIKIVTDRIDQLAHVEAHGALQTLAAPVAIPTAPPLVVPPVK